MQKFKINETTATYRRIYMYLASPTDGYTPVTSPLAGATVNLFKNGVAFTSQPTTPASLTHISNGHWYYTIDASYLSELGILTVTVQDANIRTVVLMAEVVDYTWYSSTGATAQQVWEYATRTLSAGAITSTTIANNAITLRLANDAIPSNARFTTYDTFSGYPLLSQSAQHQVSITGSHHAAADVHQFQPNVLDSTATDATFVNEIVDAIWDELASGHSIPGSFGKLIDLISKANYVTEGTVTSVVAATNTTFTTTLTNESGSLDHQSLLFITGDHVGTSIPILNYSLSNGAVELEEPLHQPPGVGDTFVVLPQHVHAIVAIADGIMNRLLDSSGSSVDQVDERTVRSALRAMRNKVDVSSGSITVYKENDGDVAWTGTVSNITDVTVDPTGG